MLWRERLAIMPQRENRGGAEKIGQRQVRCVAVLGVNHHVARFGTQLHAAHELEGEDSAPMIIESAPTRDAVHVGENFGLREIRKFVPRKPQGTSNKPKTRKSQVCGSNCGTEPSCSTGHLRVNDCPAGRRPAARIARSFSRRSLVDSNNAIGERVCGKTGLNRDYVWERLFFQFVGDED